VRWGRGDDESLSKRGNAENIVRIGIARAALRERFAPGTGGSRSDATSATFALIDTASNPFVGWHHTVAALTAATPLKAREIASPLVA
jgi:hypothetical protein